MPTAALDTQPSGHGEPICAGRLGTVISPFTVNGGVETGTVSATNAFQVKVTLVGAPVMGVTPSVCELDLGQPRLVTQCFALSGGPEPERLFKNTVLWLLHAWYCINVDVQLAADLAPTTGRLGDELVYAYTVQHTGGACGAVGVTLSEQMPEGWLIRDVQVPDGTWNQVGSWLFVTLGCFDQGAQQTVQLRLLPTQAGTFTHTVQIRAEAKTFVAEGHLVQVTTVIEPADLAPRLELRQAGPAGRYALRVRGATGINYRVQASGNLLDWQDLAIAAGPQADVPVPADPAGSTGHYFRAVWP